MTAVVTALLDDSGKEPFAFDFIARFLGATNQASLSNPLAVNGKWSDYLNQW